jgi:hypothetical protein
VVNDAAPFESVVVVSIGDALLARRSSSAMSDSCAAVARLRSVEPNCTTTTGVPHVTAVESAAMPHVQSAGQQRRSNVGLQLVQRASGHTPG